MVEILCIIVWFGLATVLFSIVTKAMNITYFGFSSVFSTWFGCLIAVGVVGGLLFGLASSLFTMIVDFVTHHYKWIIGGVVVLGALAVWGSKADTKEAVEQPKE